MTEEPSLQPIYTMLSVNAPILLYSGRLIVEQGSKSFEGTGTLSYEWLPKPTCKFSVSLDESGHVPEVGEAALRHDEGSSPSYKVGIFSSEREQDHNTSTVRVSGSFSLMTRGNDSQLSACIFHLPNFTRFLGKIIDVGGKRFYRGRAVMEWSIWKVTLQLLPSSDKKLYESLSSLGGCAFTNVGEIRRRDGRPFKAKVLQPALESITWWLSFCRGFWVAPLLPVGLGSDGNPKWFAWVDYNVDRSQGIMTWADPHTESFLEDTFAGFMKRMESETWAEPIRLSVWWYLAGNTKGGGGMEGALILMQAAFELLAWTLFVEERHMTEEEFGKMKASQKIRLLLSKASIPILIPDYLQSLCKVAAENDWQDGPRILTEIRNGLVHPALEKRRIVINVDGLAMFEAWNLSLWYLELLLLWLFNYKGRYVNRLRREIPRTNAVETVPWDC
jgi:hypothetical protein